MIRRLIRFGRDTRDVTIDQTLVPIFIRFGHSKRPVPTQHLKRLRVERARSLLLTTDQNITEIAHQCGFMTSQHFARIFRQFTLMSASDYREKARLPM